MHSNHRSIGQLISILLRQLLKQPKCYLVFFLLGTIVDEYVGSSREIIQNYGIHVNAYGSFACLTSYAFLLLWLVIGFLVIVSDAPFASPLTNFVHVRITPAQSLLGRMLYVFVLAFLYVICVFFLMVLVEGASLTALHSWDKALYTMAYGNAVGGVYLYTPNVIISSLTPIQAFGRAIIPLICVLTGFGWTILAASLCMDKKAALCGIGILSALDFSIGYMHLPEMLYYVSPLSWCRLELALTANFTPGRPNAAYFQYMPIVFLIVLLIIMLSWLTRPEKIVLKITKAGGNENV